MPKHVKLCFRNLWIPSNLKADLEILAHKPALLNKSYYLLSRLSIGHIDKEYRNTYDYKPIPKTLLVLMLGKRYHKTVNVLLENEIIQRDKYYTEGKCYGYRIHFKYFEEIQAFVNIKFSYKYTFPTTVGYVDNKWHTAKFIESFNTLEIPFLKLYQAIEERVESISIRDFTVNEAIAFQRGTNNVYVMKKGDRKKVTLTQENALIEARNSSKILVKDENSIYMIDEDFFVRQKRIQIEMAWKSCIANISSEKSLYARRNGTNNRLDTNFTNMPSALLKIIYEENNLIEVDIKNSQPAILAHIIGKKGLYGEDLKRFYSLTQSGKFYDKYAAELSKDRKIIKTMMFEVLFGKWNSRTENKSRFTKDFPTVALFIQWYKKKHGNNEFCIMLQQFESNLFIDQIYEPLASRRQLVFTKHDSIAFPKKDIQHILKMMNSVFTKHSFIAELVITDYSLNINAA